MEVSGKIVKVSSLKDLETYVILCQPCTEDEKSKLADGICKQCDEYMCYVCFKNHLVARPCRNHELIDSEGTRVNPRMEVDYQNTEMCSKHNNEIIKYFCRQHDEIACGECMLLGEHKGCNPELIRHLSSNFQLSEEFTAFSNRIDRLVGRTTSTFNAIKAEKKNNEKMRESAETDIKKFIGDITESLKETESVLLSKVNEIYQQNEESLNKASLINKSTEEKINKVKHVVNPEQCPEDTLFIKCIQCKPELIYFEKSCDETIESHPIRSFGFRKESILLNKLKEANALGSISHTIRRLNEQQDTADEVIHEASLENTDCTQYNSLSTMSSDHLADNVEAPTFGMSFLPCYERIGRKDAGTAIGPKRGGIIKILWSDGTIQNCKYGVNGQYDVLVSDDQSIDCSNMHIGSHVVRGKNWKWKDQDGGEGNVGVITKIDGSIVNVVWPHGVQGNYRYGYRGMYDLSLSKSRGKTELK